MRPRIVMVSLHEDGTLRDAERFDLPPLHARIGALRFDASLYFANAAYFEEAVLRLERDRPDIVFIMVAAHSINDIDATGVETLRNLAQRLRESGVTLVLSGVKSKVLDILERTGAVEVLGRDNLYGSDHAAIADLHARLGRDRIDASPQAP
jgi:SulP family sulfate permease